MFTFIYMWFFWYTLINLTMSSVFHVFHFTMYLCDYLIYLIYLIIWFVWYDCDIMLFVVDVCACVEWVDVLRKYPEKNQAQDPDRQVPSKFKCYNGWNAREIEGTQDRIFSNGSPQRWGRVRPCQCTAADLTLRTVLESWDSHLMICKGWPAIHFFGQSLCTHQMINAIMQGLYMSVFFDMLYFLILLHSFYLFFL